MRSHLYRFTLADALLGIETTIRAKKSIEDKSFTLADALLGIETIEVKVKDLQEDVSLWLMPF